LGFTSLQHLRDRKSTRRGFAAPARFRLQGLVTLWTAYSFRALAGFVSRRRRSWDSPFGAFSSRKVSAAFPRGCTHVPFRPSVIPPPKRWAGPTSRGFWGSTLPGIPAGQTGFNSPTAGCSLGLYPPRAFRREPGPSVGPGSSLTLLRPRPQGSASPGVSEFRSTLAWPDPPSRQAERPERAALSGFLHRYEPAHASVLLPGLWVHLVPRRTSLPTAGTPEAVRRSTGVVRASPEVPNIRAAIRSSSKLARAT
jgi:hypothetical protein